MQLQGRNLQPDLTGADVALLHFELKLIGHPPPEDEVANNTFGPGTEQAVKAFQAKNWLKQSGVVDEETAKAINTQVAKQPVNTVLARLGEEIARYQAQIDQNRQGSAGPDKEWMCQHTEVATSSSWDTSNRLASRYELGWFLQDRSYSNRFIMEGAYSCNFKDVTSNVDLPAPASACCISN